MVFPLALVAHGGYVYFTEQRPAVSNCTDVLPPWQLLVSRLASEELPPPPRPIHWRVSGERLRAATGRSKSRRRRGIPRRVSPAAVLTTLWHDGCDALARRVDGMHAVQVTSRRRVHGDSSHLAMALGSWTALVPRGGATRANR